MNISGFADEIAPELEKQIEGLRKLGISFLEIRGVNGKNIAQLTADEAKAVKTQLDNRDVRISAIGSPIGKIGILDDFSQEEERFKRVLETAAVLNAPYIRMFSFFMPQNADIYRDETAARWQRYLQLAKGYPVILLHENEKGIFGDTPERCKWLMETMASAQMGLTFDPANFVQCGVDTLEAYRMLKPYITYVHAKDAKTDGSVVPCGMGDGNVYEIFTDLQKSGFDGFFSVEPHLGDFDGFSALEQGNDGKEPAMKKSDFELFSLAYDALMHIMEG